MRATPNPGTINGMAQAYSLPKQWEDWASWILGIWLILSPWVLGFHLDQTATTNVVVLGFLIVFTEVVELSIFRDWEEWINVLLGAWLLISPWILRITEPTAIADCLIVGLFVLGLAIYEIRYDRASAP